MAIINCLNGRDYAMIESIVKSDHRPVHCEYLIREQPSKDGQSEKPLLLTLKNLVFEGATKENPVWMKVCCPLPCEDCQWEQREAWIEVVNER